MPLTGLAVLGAVVAPPTPATNAAQDPTGAVQGAGDRRPGTPTASATPPTTTTADTPITTTATPPAATGPTSPGSTVASQPAQTQPQPTQPTQPQGPNLCGAPANPYGYNFCGGSYIYSPAADICSYLSCIDNFWNGQGYVIQCKDGMFSKSGGRSGSCSYHSGNRRPLYG
jgi:hypothetical protein